MTNSILLTIKKMLGISEEYHPFDIDIIVNINSVFLSLNQLGVGPSTPFQITGEDETWTDFIDPALMPGIQTYVYLKVRLLFDPPTNSFLVDNIQKQISEFEFRMNVRSEYELEVESDNGSVEDSEPIRYSLQGTLELIKQRKEAQANVQSSSVQKPDQS